MANVIDGRRTYIAAIYIARTTAGSIIYTRRHSNQIALAVRPIYIHITDAVAVVIVDVVSIDAAAVGISRIRIVYASRVNIYTIVSASRTRTRIARANAGGERTSSVQIIRDGIAVIAYRLC